MWWQSLLLLLLPACHILEVKQEIRSLSLETCAVNKKTKYFALINNFNALEIVEIR